MNERKIKVCADLRQWIFSKRDLWRQASEAAAACDSIKDQWYLEGVKGIYDVFDMMIDNFEEDPAQVDPIAFIGQIVNHSSGRILTMRLERDKADNLQNKEGVKREGMICAWNEILNFTREMRRSFNEEYLKKKEDQKNDLK